MNDREKFEADAKELGFDLTRTEFNPNVEPWDDYIEDDTGHRYGGFIAGYQAATAESAARIAELEKAIEAAALMMAVSSIRYELFLERQSGRITISPKEVALENSAKLIQSLITEDGMGALQKILVEMGWAWAVGRFGNER